MEAGFNRSSEHHELTSYYTLTSKKIPQVKDLDLWEKLSREDPLFVLDMPWLPATCGTRKMTIRKLVDRIGHGAEASLDSSDALARFVFHNNGGPRKRR